MILNTLKYYQTSNDLIQETHNKICVASNYVIRDI